jgi:hypothetical protein
MRPPEELRDDSKTHAWRVDQLFVIFSLATVRSGYFREPGKLSSLPAASF